MDENGYVNHVNGFHNWTQFQDQNWGASNGDGGGYAANLYLGAFDRDLGEVGHDESVGTYPVQKRGGNIKFEWDFGSRFSHFYPIEEGAGQLNSEEVSQWVWAWAYGP